MIPFIDFHSHHPKPKRDLIQVVNKFPSETFHHSSDEYYSMGIHPWYITENSIEEDIEIIDFNLLNNNIQFVGECGLDRLKGSDLKIQQQVFIRQVELAEKYQKPVVIHCVKAYNEIVEIKVKRHSKIPWVIHGFSGSQPLAHQLLDRGFYLSLKINSAISSTRLDMLKSIPLNRLFLESDDADLNIEESYAIFAQLLDVSIDELKLQIFNNFKLLTSTL